MHAVCSTSGRPYLLPAARDGALTHAGSRRFSPNSISLPRKFGVCCSSLPSSDEEESLARKFERYAGPSKYKQASSHLDLVWNVAKSRQPAACDCCSGSGERECKFCRGTGAMMLGDMYFCSLALGCKSCPVCKAKGQVACKHCKGTGFRAGWMEPGCPL